jgi:hypothetical protein
MTQREQIEKALFEEWTVEGRQHQIFPSKKNEDNF